MGKWVVLSFLVFGGALVAFLLVFPHSGREEASLTRGDGAQIYRQACAVCHGERGEGKSGLGRPLRGRALPVSLIKQVIRRGKNKMPALPHIQGAALDGVARHVHRLP